MNIQFIDLAAQQANIKNKIDKRIQTVLSHGQYIMGPEVVELEQELCRYSGATHCVTCSSGTDALLMTIMAMELQADQGVLLPSFTFAATAEVVALLGAIPIFCDIDASTFNIDIDSLERAYHQAHKENLHVAGIIAVDMFGVPANYDAINAFAQDNNLWVIGDSAQGFGSTYHKKRSGSLTQLTTTSFFPAKPLGCYGDGGAILTDNEDWANKLRSIRVHGKGEHKYSYERIGLNGRLDTIQAAILLEKLAIFDVELQKRGAVAQRYNNYLSECLDKPIHPSCITSAWAQYTIIIPDNYDRSTIQAELKRQGIPSVVYYPKPLHLQSAYYNSLKDPKGLQTTEMMSQKVLSLPMHPYLKEEVQDYIIQNLNQLFSNN